MLMKTYIDKYLMTEILEDFSDATGNSKTRYFNKRVPYETWKLLKSICKWNKRIFVEYDLDKLTFRDEENGNYVCILNQKAEEAFVHFFNDCIEWASISIEMETEDQYNMRSLSSWDTYKNINADVSIYDICYDNKEKTINNTIGNTNSTINYNTQEERKETKTMNMFSKINLEFGPVASNIIRLSPFGLAIKTANREWHTYDAVNQKIVDVSDFSFNLGETPLLYKMPVAPDAVAVGDLILHNGVPVYVLDFADAANKSAGFIVIDTDANERKTILPVCNVFNFNFITKVVSLFNFGNGANIFGTPTADQPFGNILPLMMMSEIFGKEGKTGDNDFFKMMMMSQIFSNGSNPFAAMLGGLNATPVKTPGGPTDA